MSFSDLVNEWAEMVGDSIDAVHARSVEMLAEEMVRTKGNGGRLPFQTGNLARSIAASTSGMPDTANGPFTDSNVGLVTASLGASQDVWLGFQANYARRMNYGFVGTDAKGRTYNQEGNHFVEGAVAEWPSIVIRAIEEVRDGS